MLEVRGIRDGTVRDGEPLYLAVRQEREGTLDDRNERKTWGVRGG